MALSPNRVRARLARHQPAAGCMLFSWSPNVVEVAGRCGLDYVRVDAEHAWRQDAMLEHLARAAAATGVELMVRLDRDNPYLVRKALEIGAGCVLVANIRTLDEARAVAAAGRFPPLGTRGFSGYCRSAEWSGVPATEWIAWSNTQPMIGIMIEDPSALDHVDAMMGVDGIDFVNFGPADFALNLGLPAPDRNDPRVVAGLRRTIDAARRAGKHAMCNIPPDRASIANHRAMGLTMLELGTDVDGVRAMLTSALAAIDRPEG
jgi:4-hydroxy-2-oxoheptanedioate aldolase